MFGKIRVRNNNPIVALTLHMPYDKKTLQHYNIDIKYIDDITFFFNSINKIMSSRYRDCFFVQFNPSIFITPNSNTNAHKLFNIIINFINDGLMQPDTLFYEQITKTSYNMYFTIFDMFYNILESQFIYTNILFDSQQKFYDYIDKSFFVPLNMLLNIKPTNTISTLIIISNTLNDISYTLDNITKKYTKSETNVDSQKTFDTHIEYFKNKLLIIHEKYFDIIQHATIETEKYLKNNILYTLK